MKKVVLVQYPSVSHLNASFKIADTLVKNGYEVFYYIHSKIAVHAQKHNFNVYCSFASPVVEEYDEVAMKLDNIKYPYLERFRDLTMNILIENRRNELTKMINELMPNIIISDTFAGSDFALIYNLLKERNIKYFHMETMLSSSVSNKIPYIDSKAFPNETAKIFAGHLKRKLIKGWQRFYKKVIYLGYDPYTLLNNEIKNKKIPSKYRIDNRNYMDITFTNIPSLLTSPIELEFFNEPQNPDQHYLGFFINESRSAIPDLDERLSRIIQSQNKIIYISFGTVFGDKMSEVILNFMKKINNIAKKNKQLSFIFSLGKAKWSSVDINSLTYINTFTFVPQPYLLGHCSLFITHGGLNSIKEAIQKIAPMLILPLDIDQFGNARKIALKKMGLLGNIRTESESVLKRKIETLINNQETKENIKMFKKIIADKYDIEKLLLSILEQKGTVE